MEAVERGIPGRAEGLPTVFAPIPLLALAVDDDMTVADATRVKSNENVTERGVRTRCSLI